MPDQRESMTSPAFQRHIGIDYSGAQTPDSSLKGLRVYEVGSEFPPQEVAPPPSPRKYWTRRVLAHWLAVRLSEDVPTIVGIDHGFSFPLRYFEVHHLVPDWPAFLDDFHRHWPKIVVETRGDLAIETVCAVLFLWIYLIPMRCMGIEHLDALHPDYLQPLTSACS